MRIASCNTLFLCGGFIFIKIMKKDLLIGIFKNTRERREARAEDEWFFALL